MDTWVWTGDLKIDIGDYRMTIDGSSERRRALGRKRFRE